MSITESIAEICESNAGGRKVLTVVLEIGELSNVIAESIEFCFEAVIKDTVLDGAKLVIEKIPGRGRCCQCGAELEVSTLYNPCPYCGGYHIDVLSGEELRVKELEVA